MRDKVLFPRHASSSSSSCTRIALLLLLSLLTLFNVAHASIEVSYQIHSNNDLRQWLPTLQKGSNWFKFDLNYNTPVFCNNHTNTRATDRVNPNTNQLGCFLLNHDTPSLLRPTPYNTSDDILSFLSDTATAPWFQRSSQKIHIALCMKYGASSNLCDGSAAAHNTTLLFTDFFDRAQSLLSSNSNYNVEFILDGSLTPGGANECLKSLWQPWNATFIYADGPAAAYTSNNASVGYNRFQINNMDEESFVLASLSNYGKFAFPENRTDGYTKSYPFLIWEPSDQLTLLSNTANYLSGLRHRGATAAERLSHEIGVRFAINIDPVQFNIYTASATGLAVNLPLSNSFTDTFPKIAAFSAVTAITTVNTYPLPYTEPSFLVAIWFQPPSKQFVYNIFQLPQGLSTPLPVFSSPRALGLDSSSTRMSRASLTGQLDSVVAIPYRSDLELFNTQDCPKAAVLLSDDDGSVIIADFSIPSPLSSPLFTAQLGVVSNFSRVGVSAAYVGSALNNTLQLLQATADPSQHCALMLRAWIVRDTTLVPYPSFTNECLIDSQDSIADFDKDSVSLSLVPANDTSLCPSSANINTVQVAFMLSFTHANSSYAVTGCIGHQSPVLPVISYTAPALVGVGNKPSVSLAVHPNTGELHALLTLADSYCFNNEVANKRAAIALCDSVPNAQTNIQTYRYATLKAFQAALAENAPNGITPCNQAGVLHGMYDSGSVHHSSLVPLVDHWNSTHWRMGAVELHRGVPSTKTASMTTAHPAAHSVHSPASATATRHADKYSHAKADKKSNTDDRRRTFVSTFSTVASVNDPLPASVCGASLAHDGIVLDAWMFPSLLD